MGLPPLRRRRRRPSRPRSASAAARGTLNTEGLEIDEAALAELLTVDEDLIREQLPQVKEHLAKFGERLPNELNKQLADLERRLS